MNFLDYQMRGGEHPDLEREELEKQIASMALRIFTNNPHYNKKGVKWCFNFAWFHTIYCARDKSLIEFLQKKRFYPEQIEVEVSTVCPLKCQMCEHTYWKEKNQLMSFKNFVKIIEQFPNLREVGLTGIGESYLNPDYKKMLSYLKEKYEGIFIEIFDTFNWLKPEDIKHWIDIGLDKVYVSMDAATKETYEKIRVNATYENVIKNIKLLDKMKKEKNSYFPELWFHYIIGKHNKHEILQYLEMIHSLKVDVTNVQITKLLHNYSEIKDWFIDLTEEEKREIMEKGKELGIPVSFNINTGEKPSINNCTVWGQPFIFVDGTITPCCSLNEQNDRPWQVKNSLGNILKEDFIKIWKGEKYKEMINAIQLNKICASCGRCILYENSIA